MYSVVGNPTLRFYDTYVANTVDLIAAVTSVAVCSTFHTMAHSTNFTTYFAGVVKNFYFRTCLTQNRIG